MVDAGPEPMYAEKLKVSPLGLFGDVVECLISNPSAWVPSPPQEKVISIFSPVTDSVVVYSLFVVASIMCEEFLF